MFFATGYDSQRALGVFDKLKYLETREDQPDPDSHDAATVRKQAISAVLADLQRFHASRHPGPR
jgi:hypothetical protein